ncbi:hypothetical protein UA08_03262 [Talaromyces atroroseus]|uniref:Uncharacterized protein n=1 Tax=Talaromyces atroroseus TaxID=1441469 RepID=A0A225AJC3_TALAT|nr:hypothetical protein UA08_03262 [Talaromyces atroroseus]OKL61581.1 hypothetical protein UA08_03262 [Talaromyces atroroseus]
MPRPAIPKPGFSVLRLHNSKNPHLIAHLSSAEKRNLLNSVAQDIEGCIWVVGHYIQSGHLDATHTFEFDQIINEIHRDERDEMEKKLRKMTVKTKIYKRREKALRREMKKRQERRRQRREERRRDEQQRMVTSSQQTSVDPTTADVECFETGCLHAGPSNQIDRDPRAGSGRGLSAADNTTTQVTVVSVDEFEESFSS